MIKVYRKPQGGLIGIDIGSTSIKKLELSKQGNTYQIDDYAVVSLPLGAVVEKNIVKQEEVVLRLEQIMQGSKDKNTGIAFAIPTSNITTRVEQVDAILTDGDVEQHVHAQVGKYIPFPVSEVCMDYLIRPNLTSNATKKEVVIVAAKNDSVSPKVEAFEAAGIKVHVATVESFAVEKVIPFIVDSNSDKSVVLLDLGFSNTTLYVIKAGKIIYSRDHEFGGNILTKEIQDRYSTDLIGAEEIKLQKIAEGNEDFKDDILLPFFNDVVQQLNQAITLCTSSTDVGEISSILLAGGSAGIEGLPAYIEDELGFDIQIANPFKNMVFAPTVDKKAFYKDQASLLTVFGLALCDIGECVNLLPWREQLNQQKKRSYIAGAVLAGLIGFGCSFGAWSYHKAQYNASSQANEELILASQEIDAKLEELKEVTTLRETTLERMRLIQNLQTTRPTIVSVTNSVVKSLPPEAYLTSFSKDGDSFEFKGKALDAQVVAQFMRSMSESKWFTGITLVSFESFKQDKNGSAQPDEKLAKNKPEDKYGEFKVSANLSTYAIERVENSSSDQKITIDESAIINTSAIEKENSQPVENSNQSTQSDASVSDVNKTEPNPTSLNGQEIGVAPPPPSQIIDAPDAAPDRRAMRGLGDERPQGRQGRTEVPMVDDSRQAVNGGANE